MLFLSAAFARGPVGEPPGDPARGGRLAGLASCEACHTAEGGTPYAGGHGVVTDFGTFFGPNLTPDPAAGLGGWAYGDFVDAMTRGRRPGGGHYWAAFPYPSFAGLQDPELRDLWAFLRALPADPRPDQRHETQKTGVERWAWHALFFDRRAWRPGADPSLEAGRYLVEVVGHCPECHTPRTKLGRLRREEGMSGSGLAEHGGPDIRPATLGWSDGDWGAFLEMGMLPDGDFVGGGMYAVIRDGTSQLLPGEREAMIRALTAP